MYHEINFTVRMCILLRLSEINEIKSKSKIKKSSNRKTGVLKIREKTQKQGKDILSIQQVLYYRLKVGHFYSNHEFIDNLESPCCPNHSIQWFLHTWSGPCRVPHWRSVSSQGRFMC